MNKKRTLVLTGVLTIMILFFVTALHIYTPYNYHLQYNLHDTYKSIDSKKATNATQNLIGYFLHYKPLNTELFSNKEIKHYKDVRKIYDGFFILFILSSGIFFILQPSKKEIISVLEKIRYIILFPLIILPIFGFFWNNIFHSIFSNPYWIMYSYEISYYLFPQEFFSYTLISIIIWSEIIIFTLLYELKIK